MALCENCICYDSCADWADQYEDTEFPYDKCFCYKPKDRFIELPCKVGDEVWAIRDYKGKKYAQRGFVSEMFFRKDMSIMIVVKHIARGIWGEDIFPTQEVAEATPNERKEK